MPVGDDATSGCLSPSGHYNPFQVDVNVSFFYYKQYLQISLFLYIVLI